MDPIDRRHLDDVLSGIGEDFSACNRHLHLKFLRDELCYQIDDPHPNKRRILRRANGKISGL